VRQLAERPIPRGLLIHQARAMLGWSQSKRLSGLQLPVTVVHGAQDVFSPVANGRALGRLIPEARYHELEGVGHLVPLEAPGRLDDALDALARYKRPSG
jgi:3-oxoadipate enol-lactonase